MGSILQLNKSYIPQSLDKFKLIDAVFVYTEPHSRRIKVKVTIQKEIIQSASIQESRVIDFKEENLQCPDCKKEFTPHTWGALIQVYKYNNWLYIINKLRTKSAKKNNLFYIEQMILQNKLEDKILKTEALVGEICVGLDLKFKDKQQALIMVDFIHSVIPCKVTTSKELVSHDSKNNTYHQKYVWCLQLPVISKNEIILFPQNVAKSLGGISPVQLCTKISSTMHFKDVITHKEIEMPTTNYFKIESSLTISNIETQEFQVIDIETTKKGIMLYTLMSEDDDYNQFTVKSHDLKAQVGDTVIGYNLNQLEEPIKSDIILIQKKKIKQKSYKRMEIEQEGVIKKGQQKKMEQEFEEFTNEYDDEEQNQKSKQKQEKTQGILQQEQKEPQKNEDIQNKNQDNQEQIQIQNVQDS